MVGGFPGKVKGRYPAGTLHRPCSVGDFNDVEDEGCNIDQMSDQEVASEFEKMLENMNLSEVLSKYMLELSCITLLVYYVLTNVV